MSHRLRGLRVSRLVIPASLALAVATLPAACSEPADDVDSHEAIAVAVAIPLDSLLPIQDETTLLEHPDHVIGGQSDAAIDRDGRLFIADMMMKELKVFDRDGNFLNVVGRVGQGPGEYAAPISIALSRGGDVVAVGDIGLSRVLIYDQPTLELLNTIQLSVPVSLQALLLGPDSTLMVAGNAANYFAETPYQAVLVTEGDSLIRSFLPIPTNLRNKAMGGSVLSGIGDQTDNYAYFTLSASPVIYRYAYSGDVVDSLLLPPEIYAGVELPEIDGWKGGMKEMQEYTQSESWVSTLVALDDTRLALELASYDPDEADWIRQLIIVDWQDAPRAWKTEPCACELLTHRGDTLAVLAGGPPDPYRVEWRTLGPTLEQ